MSDSCDFKQDSLDFAARKLDAAYASSLSLDEPYATIATNRYYDMRELLYTLGFDVSRSVDCVHTAGKGWWS